MATEKPFAPPAIRQIREVTGEAGHELILLENYKSPAELLAAAADADALIVRSDLVTAEVLGAAKKLRIVVRAGAGYDNIDLAACTARNVVAMNTPGQNSNAVAELAFGMMLFQARSGFSGKSGTELRGKTIGLHAFGNVSRYMASIAGGFGMNVSAFDPSFVGLSGSPQQLEPVWKAYGVYHQANKAAPGDTQYAVEHSSNIYLVDTAGNLRLTYAFGTAVDDILQDVRHLLKQKG